MFESGEATIDYQTSAAYLKNSVPLVEQGKAVVMMSWGALMGMVTSEIQPSLTSRHLRKFVTRQMGVKHQGLGGRHGKPSSLQAS